ncbi:MAG: ATP-binding protein [Cyanosarcina radialis HA8281-LM2]|jgi:hypothetical protein|nr:ATP-binding protein [Cyanosarcina radialis HA8281-LM2]
MKINISLNSSFEEIYSTAYEAYQPGNLRTLGYRNLIIKIWGSMVGRKRALDELGQFIQSYGTQKSAAKALHMSPSTLRSITHYFKQLPEDTSPIPQPLRIKMVCHETLNFDENREFEFKEVKGGNPIDSIKNTVDEYAIAFLNSEGGRILWGINDVTKTILGVHLSNLQRDELRRVINNKLMTIEPTIDPTAFRIELHHVYDDKKQIINDLFVIELICPKSNTQRLHFSSSGKTWVRVDGVKQLLKGSALQDWIMRRISIELETE